MPGMEYSESDERKADEGGFVRQPLGVAITALLIIGAAAPAFVFFEVLQATYQSNMVIMADGWLFIVGLSGV
jgi:hypothetical protein